MDDTPESARDYLALPPELRRRVREGVELLRPHPHRGDLIGAGAVPLTVALLLINLRLDDSWGQFVFLLLNALAAGLVLGMGVLAPLEGERSRSYQVVLQLCGLALLFVALLRLLQVLGADEPLDSAGSAFVILALVAATAAWLARERRSEICTLVAGIVGTAALYAFVRWAFSPESANTARWVLLLAAVLLLAGALLLRDRHRRDSVYLIDAAGVAILALGLTFVVQLIFGAIVTGIGGEFSRASAAPGLIWKLVLLAAGLGLVAYSGVDREAGPGYLGATILLLFTLLVGMPGESGPSLWFWPLALLLIGGAMIAAGLRPRRELPPEPDRGGPAPVVPAPVAPPPAPPPVTPASIASQEPRPAAPASEAISPPTPPWMRPPAEEGSSEFVAEPDEAPTRAVPPASPGPDSEPVPHAAPEPTPAPRPEPEPEPEPPARGSLWARADPGEEPTRQHRVPPRDDDAS